MASHGHHDHAAKVQVIPADKAKIRKIWMTCLILGIVTAIEFVFAFSMPRGNWLIAIFVFLTFVKTFYIVGEFMHLKYEVKVLIWSIILPMAFIVWLITAMIVEGGAIFHLRQWF